MFDLFTWTLTFFVLAVTAAFIGFGGMILGATSIAKILFFAFGILFLGSFVFNLFDTMRHSSHRERRSV